MAVKFCPKCKGILIPKNIGEKSIIACKNCNYIHEAKVPPLIEEEDIKPKPDRGEGIAKDENEFATYKHECEKCGYGKAQIIDMGVFISDEDNLIMLKCGKCGFSERIGRKTS
jgi:transcription factor S